MEGGLLGRPTEVSCLLLRLSASSVLFLVVSQEPLSSGSSEDSLSCRRVRWHSAPAFFLLTARVAL